MAQLLDNAKSLRIPGRLCKDPTAIGTYPHGGTDLGYVSGVTFAMGIISSPVIGEEKGGKIVDRVKAKGTPIIGCFLEGFNNEMVKAVFKETFTGGSTGAEGIRQTTTTKSGRLGSDDAFKLLFSPRNTTDHPGIVLYNAIPLIELTAEINLNTEFDGGMFVFFEALENGSGKDFEMQLLADMSLT